MKKGGVRQSGSPLLLSAINFSSALSHRLYLSGCMTAAAVSVLIWQRFRPHDKADLFVNQVAAQTAENAVQTQENETKE